MPGDVRGLALQQHPDRRNWVIAWSLALALHVLAMVGVQARRHFVPVPPPTPKLEPLKLRFVSPAATSAAPEQPNYFTELPADRADQAPDKADFLSNVTSRARDQVAGGNESLPRTTGVSDAPAVALEKGKVEPSPASASRKPSAADVPSPAAADGKVTLESPKGAGRTPTTPLVLRDGSSSSERFPSASAAPGNSDIHQPAMDNPQGNAALSGDVSLNTTAWEWSPWIQRFGRRLMSVWTAPPAYYLGVLKEGGWTVVELEIARSGEVLRMDVLEEQGHPSLIRAATSALRSISPMEALPADFPEKTLILRVRMVYPKFRPL